MAQSGLSQGTLRQKALRYYQTQTTDGQQQPVKSLAQSVAACVTKNPPCAACSSCRRAGSVSCVFTGRVMSSIACAFSDGTLRTAEMIPFRIRFSSLMRRAFSMRLASSSARSRLTWIVRRISSSSFSRQNSVFSAYLNSCSMMLSLLLPPSRRTREHARQTRATGPASACRPSHLSSALYSACGFCLRWGSESAARRLVTPVRQAGGKPEARKQRTRRGPGHAGPHLNLSRSTMRPSLSIQPLCCRNL